VPLESIRPVSRAVTKSEFAYQEIRNLILNGELHPGERLSLRPLASQLGVSVMPVRDAIRQLEIEGLIITSDHHGARVAQVSREEILECVSVRMWLEVHAVRETARQADPGVLEQARAALVLGRSAVSEGDGEAFTKANREFHRAIEQNVDRLTASLINDLWDRLWQVRRSSLFVRDSQRMELAQQEHEAIFAAVDAGEVEAASKAAQVHREETLRSWAAALPVTDG
jgi:DNA-binding GntR family transcriptional regulator